MQIQCVSMDEGWRQHLTGSYRPDSDCLSFDAVASRSPRESKASHKNIGVVLKWFCPTGRPVPESDNAAVRSTEAVAISFPSGLN